MAGVVMEGVALGTCPARGAANCRLHQARTAALQGWWQPTAQGATT